MRPAGCKSMGLAAYMGGVSRKTVYAAVAAGMRVVRLGDAAPRRDSRGRLVQGRMLFSPRWIDEFLESRSTGTPLQQPVVDAGRSLTRQPDAGRANGPIATPLQRAAEVAGAPLQLAAESRAALDVIDLHFHDLRHEGGSRLLEAGWPLHHAGTREPLADQHLPQRDEDGTAREYAPIRRVRPALQSRCNRGRHRDAA